MRGSTAPLSHFLGHRQADMISCSLSLSSRSSSEWRVILSFSQREKQAGRGRERPQCPFIGPFLYAYCFLRIASVFTTHTGIRQYLVSPFYRWGA